MVQVAQTTFVGRLRELEELQQCLLDGQRLTTLLGPAGMGKTRLLRELQGRGEDCVFVDLSGCRNEHDVVLCVAGALDVDLSPADDALDSSDVIRTTLAARGPTITLLDNFEQVSHVATTTILRWLEAPEALFVVGSRHRLNVAGERVFELGPLSVADAVDLFVDRARMVRRDFDRDGANAQQLVDLVQQLDRLPLALELAAARSATMSPADLLGRLHARFKLLRSRERDLADRQATLFGAIDWSWQLLQDHERQALAQVSIFRGGFTLDAAEAVVDLGDEWVVDALESLHAKSMVAAPRDGQERFIVYESIRVFAREHLPAGVAHRHAVYFAEFGEAQGAQMHGRAGNSAMRALEQESPNLFAAFTWACDADAAIALRLAASLDEMLRFVGPSDAHEALLLSAIELARTEQFTQQLTRFRRARASLLAVQGRLDEALDVIDEARAQAEGVEAGWLDLRRGEIQRTRGDARGGAEVLSVAIECGRAHHDDRLVRTALGHRAACLVDAGDLDAARETLGTLADTRRTTDLRRECELLKRTAYVQYYLGNYAEQRRQNEEALTLAVEIGDRRLEGLCLQGVGDSAFALGDFDAAVDFYARGLEIHQSLGNVHYEAMLLGNLGGAYHRSADLTRARKCYARSLELHRQTGARPYEGVVSFALGALEHESGNADDAHFHYDRALDIAVDTDQLSDVGALKLCKVWVDMESPEFGDEAIRARIRDGRADLQESDGCWAAVADATAALVARIRGEDDVAEELFSTAQAGLSGTASTERVVVTLLAGTEPADEDVVRRSLHARLARRLAGVAQGVGAGDTPSEVSLGPTITVGAQTQWFEIDDAERVDLRRRKALRLVLQHLLEQHATQPGRGSDVHEVFDAGWPDEEIHPDQAVERVYWAVRTLRKLGFEELLLTSDEGYHLRPDLTIVRE